MVTYLLKKMTNRLLINLWCLVLIYYVYCKHGFIFFNINKIPIVLF